MSGIVRFIAYLKLIGVYFLFLHFTNTNGTLKSFTIFLVLAFVSLNSFGQINMPEENKDEWYIRISPHFWFVHLKGEIVGPPIPVIPVNPIEPEPKHEIDVTFGELKGSIKFAFMGSGQYVQNRIITRFNVTSLILEADFLTPYDIVLQDVKGRFEYFSGDIGFGYDVLNRPKVSLFVIGGFKFIYMHIGLKTTVLGMYPIEGERSKWFTDNVIGAYFRYRPIKRLELTAYGDIGFLIGKEITSQVIIEANFFITPWFYVAGGYRYWYVNVPKDEAIYNGQITGSVVKIGFQIH